MSKKQFKVYEIKSPSGRCYIGFTGQSMKTRWGQHIKRSRCKEYNHPFYASIRKYGAENFTVRVVKIFSSCEEALEFEALCIANATVKLYNISPGGSEDVYAASRALQEKLKDPVFKERYLRALKEGIAKSPLCKAAHAKFAEAGKKWRKEHPKEVYRLQRRASRVAARKKEGQQGLKHTEETKRKISNLARKRKPHYTAKSRWEKIVSSREHAKEQWRNRSEEEIKALSEKISASVTNMHANKTQAEKKENGTQLAEARKNIDHEVRKSRQKKALEEYWIPERRAAKSLVMKRRSLLAYL